MADVFFEMGMGKVFFLNLPAEGSGSTFCPKNVGFWNPCSMDSKGGILPLVVSKICFIFIPIPGEMTIQFDQFSYFSDGWNSHIFFFWVLKWLPGKTGQQDPGLGRYDPKQLEVISLTRLIPFKKFLWYKGCFTKHSRYLKWRYSPI